MVLHRLPVVYSRMIFSAKGRQHLVNNLLLHNHPRKLTTFRANGKLRMFGQGLSYRQGGSFKAMGKPKFGASFKPQGVPVGGQLIKMHKPKQSKVKKAQGGKVHFKKANPQTYKKMRTVLGLTF